MTGTDWESAHARLISLHQNWLRQEAEFNAHADKWERETSLLSSPSRMAAHPSYQAIIAMGTPAVLLILRRMKRRGGHWFWALAQLTQVNPVPPEAHGNIPAVREAWLNWGSKRGYC